MSDLEEAAAAHARRQQQAAENEAARHAEVERNAHQDAALLRERARELFVFARSRGAGLYRRYDSHEIPGYQIGHFRYVRTGDMCIAAAALDSRFGRSAQPGWAVTEEGEVYHAASVRRRSDVHNPVRHGVRDSVFVGVDARRHAKYGQRGYESMNPAFVAAAAALLTPVAVSPHFPGLLTGVQSDGSVGYLL